MALYGVTYYSIHCQIVVLAIVIHDFGSGYFKALLIVIILFHGLIPVSSVQEEVCVGKYFCYDLNTSSKIAPGKVLHTPAHSDP